ncbi:membrane protein [Candidatus Magnetobacterium bavaricum]|uniref:Membrane protein n=1 Tax=Candidatus Magnetobacterium bavaricum TaxID=29290 RepID=A0A0F3GYF5_9BACT|nr:membrane protein [Candidatus Magnetobacterium bavaricum]
MPKGIPEGKGLAFISGITLIPIISMVVSLPFTLPLTYFWKTPNIKQFFTVYFIVAIVGIRGSIIENETIRHTDGSWTDYAGINKDAEGIRQATLKLSALIWIIGLIVVNLVSS